MIRVWVRVMRARGKVIRVLVRVMQDILFKLTIQHAMLDRELILYISCLLFTIP